LGCRERGSSVQTGGKFGIHQVGEGGREDFDTGAVKAHSQGLAGLAFMLRARRGGDDAGSPFGFGAMDDLVA